MDAREVHAELQAACKKLSSRGLLHSAKWASELIIGMPKSSKLHPPYSNSSKQSEEDRQNEIEEEDLIIFAKSLFDLKEYSRCSHALRHTTSMHALFLRLYSLYLAGEKRREEESLENQAAGAPPTAPPSSVPSISVAAGMSSAAAATAAAATTISGAARAENHQLKLLAAELSKKCTNPSKPSSSSSVSINNSADAYLLYLYGVVLRSMNRKQDAISAFCASVYQQPWLWASWQELTKLCESKDQLDKLQFSSPLFIHHPAYQLFRLQSLLDLSIPSEALRICESLQSDYFPSSPYLQCQSAIASYNLRDFVQAQEQFEAVRAEDPWRLDAMDCYSNILYVRDDRTKLSRLAHAVQLVDRYRPETCCIVGNYHSARREHERAVRSFGRAVRLDPLFLSAWTLMGHEYLELKNVPAAIGAYRAAVELGPRDYRAWYGLGQTYELLQLHGHAIFYFRRAASLRPYDARMWAAMASCLEALKKPAEAIRCYERICAQWKYRREEEFQKNKTKKQTVGSEVAPDPEELMALTKLGRMYQAAGDIGAATHYYRLAVRSNVFVAGGHEEEEDEGQQQPQGEESAEVDVTALLFLANVLKASTYLPEVREAEKYCLRVLECASASASEIAQARSCLKEIRAAASAAQAAVAAANASHLSSSSIGTPFHFNS